MEAWSGALQHGQHGNPGRRAAARDLSGGPPHLLFRAGRATPTVDSLCARLRLHLTTPVYIGFSRHSFFRVSIDCLLYLLNSTTSAPAMVCARRVLSILSLWAGVAAAVPAQAIFGLDSPVTSVERVPTQAEISVQPSAATATTDTDEYRIRVLTFNCW